MKKTVGSLFGWSRRNFVLLGIVLSLAAFGYSGLKSSAGSVGAGQGDTLPALDLPLFTIDEAKMNRVERAATVTVTESTDPKIHLDMAALGIKPITGKLPSMPEISAVGVGNAMLSLGPEIANENTAGAITGVGTNFLFGETVEIFINGVSVTTLPLGASDRFSITVTTGSGFGAFTMQAVGLTSGRRSGSVIQIANTGPYAPSVAAGPHAINPNGSSLVTFAARGYPPSSTINVRRNGVLIATTPTNAQGLANFGILVAAAGDGSAVYSVDDGTAGSVAGQSIEERADAGTPPTGDQNITRALVDRAVGQTGVGAFILVSGEGFLPGETITHSGCFNATLTANANGGTAFGLGFGTGGFLIGNCVLTGGTSGRVARYSLQRDPNALNVRGLLVSPIYSPGSGNIILQASKLPANDTGTVYLDGVLLGTATTGASGYSGVFIPRPTGGFLHTVQWVTSTGDQMAAPFLFTPSNTTTTVTAAPVSPSVFGQSVTFTATVAPVAPGVGTPAGTVTFNIDGNLNCINTPLVAGVATCTKAGLPTLPVGLRNVVVIYNGNANFNGSAGTLNYTVNKADTTTTITGDTPDPSVIGQPYSVSWTVTPNAPGAGTPTGTVTVTEAIGQYANSVIAFSSEYTNTSWSAAQATGAPDTFAYGDIPTAWAPLLSNGPPNPEFITLGYLTPVQASGVVVRETYGNGFVTQIDLVDTGDVLHTVFTGVDPSLPGTPVDFSVTFPKTPYLVKGVKVYTDPTHDLSAWEEIDSVQLVGSVPGAVSCTAPVANGGCNLTSTTMGNKLLVATYNGDANFNASSSPNVPHTVNLQISGTVRNGLTNAPISGLSMTLYQLPLPGTPIATATTSASGVYAFTGQFTGGVAIQPTTVFPPYPDPTSRSYGLGGANITGADFLIFNALGDIPRRVPHPTQWVAPGAAGSMPVILESQNNEVNLSYSFIYDINPFAQPPTVVCGANAPGCTIAQNNTVFGRVGYTVTPAGGAFTRPDGTSLDGPEAAGPKEIARINFQTVATALPSTDFTITASPVNAVARDAANNPLLMVFITPVRVVFAQGLEGDVAGRNAGSGVVDSADVVQVRNFVTGLHTPVGTHNEFQRADTAPASTKGDGTLSATDVIQTRRYGAGLDTPPSAGGNGAANPVPVAPPPAPEAVAGGREIKIGSSNASTNSRVSIPVDLTSNGDEIAASFTVRYDETRLTAPRVDLAKDAPEGINLTVNTDEPGLIRVLVDSTTAIGSDSRDASSLINITFDVTRSAASGDTQIELDELSISDADARSLTARATSGTISISGPNPTDDGKVERVRRPSAPRVEMVEEWLNQTTVILRPRNEP